MSKHPVVKRPERMPRKVEADAVEVIGPATKANPLFSFRYSYTEISALGGKAHVKSRQTRFEDGKLTSESFEGDFDRGMYEQIVRDARDLFLGQTALLMKSLTWMLPFSRDRHPDGD